MNREGDGVARPEGFEPSTVGLEVRCSDPLSYGRLPSIVADARRQSGRFRAEGLVFVLLGVRDVATVRVLER